MTDKDFAIELKKEILNNVFQEYFTTLDTMNEKDIQDPYWKKAAKVYKSLNDENKSNLQGFIKLVMIDTVSTFLAVLDGVQFLEGQDEELVLLYNKKKINGDLQDIFLAEVEEDSEE